MPTGKGGYELVGSSRKPVEQNKIMLTDVHSLLEASEGCVSSRGENTAAVLQVCVDTTLSSVAATDFLY